MQKNNKGKYNIGDVKIETFVEMYFKDKRNLKEKSIKNKKNIIDKHILTPYAQIISYIFDFFNKNAIMVWNYERKTYI